MRRRRLSSPTPLLLLPVLLSLLIGLSWQAQPPCPALLPCRCSSRRVECAQESSDNRHQHFLDTLPYMSPADAQTRWRFKFNRLTVRGHAMTSLSLRYSWGAISVGEVEVTNSLVRRLLPGAFAGLHGVQRLNLSHNLLTSIQRHYFVNLPQLNELILHNNQLHRLHAFAFAYTPFITQLDLSHNRLTELPSAVRNLPHLTHLFLQYNDIHRIPSRGFAGLSSLAVLDLGSLGRELSIETDAFCGMQQQQRQQRHSLIALFLRNNQLQKLDLCSLGQLRNLNCLNLSGTIFPCSCHAMSLLNQPSWQFQFGFSPLFVVFQRWALLDCQPDCPAASVCQDPCAIADVEPALSMKTAPLLGWLSSCLLGLAVAKLAT